VSDKLIKQIALEQEQLNRLIDTHRSLLAQCALQPPNDIELSALGFFLHSFYSGLENIFKRIAIEIDGGSPQEEAWHRQLLDGMAAANEVRTAATVLMRSKHPDGCWDYSILAGAFSSN